MYSCVSLDRAYHVKIMKFGLATAPSGGQYFYSPLNIKSSSYGTKICSL